VPRLEGRKNLVKTLDSILSAKQKAVCRDFCGERFILRQWIPYQTYTKQRRNNKSSAEMQKEKQSN